MVPEQRRDRGTRSASPSREYEVLPLDKKLNWQGPMFATPLISEDLLLNAKAFREF